MLFGGGGDGGGVETAAEKYAGGAGVQPIGDSGIPDSEEIFYVVAGARITDVAGSGDFPIAVELQGIA